MTEPNNSSPQGQRPKTCGLAKDCFAASIGAALIAVVGDALASQPLGTFLSLPFAVIGLACGIFALRQITESKGTLAGWVPAITGIIISSVLLLVAWGSFYSLRQPGFRLVCGTNLNGLGKAMMIYANDYDGKYPTANKWCDLLIQGDYTTEKQFVCRSASREDDNGRCNYAMNPNCEPNSPRDMVLLFETEAGWNQVGGPEILTTDNHGGEGCNILFNNGHVKFVRNDLEKLKWKVEESEEKPSASQ